MYVNTDGSVALGIRDSSQLEMSTADPEKGKRITAGVDRKQPPTVVAEGQRSL